MLDADRVSLSVQDDPETMSQQYSIRTDQHVVSQRISFRLRDVARTTPTQDQITEILASVRPREPGAPERIREAMRALMGVLGGAQDAMDRLRERLNHGTLDDGEQVIWQGGYATATGRNHCQTGECGACWRCRSNANGGVIRGTNITDDQVDYRPGDYTRWAEAWRDEVSAFRSTGERELSTTDQRAQEARARAEWDRRTTSPPSLNWDEGTHSDLPPGYSPSSQIVYWDIEEAADPELLKTGRYL